MTICSKCGNLLNLIRIKDQNLYECEICGKQYYYAGDFGGVDDGG